MQHDFPYIEVSGSYQDVGQAIGTRMGPIIRKSITHLKNNTSGYADFINISKDFYDFTNKLFPQYILEMEAIANAAGVDKYDYFLHNNREVYDAAELHDKQFAAKHEHCTIAVSFTPTGIIVGHNEDWGPEGAEELYILKATVNGSTFLSLNYAPAVPGVSAGLNSWGLVQCVNDLYQKNQFGVPKYFLSRAILESKSLDDAVNLLKNTQRGSGFNHVLAQGKRAVNIEIAGDQIASDEITKPYVHTNHYISLKNVERFHTVSSDARFRRATELIRPNMTENEMKTLLSDTKDEANPICRPEETIGSLIFDTSRKSVLICKGHPCSNHYREYSL